MSKKKVIIGALVVFFVIACITTILLLRSKKEESIITKKPYQELSWKLKEEKNDTTCQEATKIIYEDTAYQYTVSNSCYIDDTYVVYNNGEKYNIQEALNQKKVSVEELINKGAQITKVAKQVTWRLQTIPSGLMCTQVITTIYEDAAYKYVVSNPCYINDTYVVYSSGEKYNIQEALKQKKVSVEELIDKGAKITKIVKQVTWTLQTIPSGLMCTQVITTIYEDAAYKYAVPNPCYVNDTYVVYSNGEKYNIQEALNQKKVSVEELINKGAKITKVAKQVTWRLQTIPSGLICTQVITTIYEDAAYKYVVSNPCYVNDTYVVYSNGEKYNIQEALNQKKVSVEELIDKGAKITKMVKQVTWTLQTIPSGLMCTQVITTIYEDAAYKYTVSNPCYIDDTYVVYSNGEKYNIQEALNQKKVSVEELINKGARIMKVAKK